MPTESPGEDLSSQRRPKRCKISREQLTILIKSFNDEPLPNFDQRQQLAKVLGMTPRSVQIWFQNRRQRLKPAPRKQTAFEKPCPSQSLVRPSTPSAQGLSSHQQLGVPGLVAVAGLCNSFSADSSLLMSKAMSQLPFSSQASSGIGSLVGGLYDVMEPFAATKALLGAGYQSQSSLALASRLSQSLSTLQPSPAVQPQVAPQRPPAAAPKAEQEQTDASQTDGLLLLLACADSRSPQPDAPKAEASAVTA